MGTERKNQTALIYLNHGFKLAKLHSSLVDGACTCPKRKDCPHSGKHPINAGWQLDLIENEVQLKQFLDARPNSNLAAYTAESKNFVALDYDKKNGGLETLEKMISLLGPLPDTPTVKTGGGGFHFYFSIPESLKSEFKFNNKAFPGLDVFTNGNLVIAGSNHNSGNTYEFEANKSLGEIPMAPLPNSWIEALTIKSKQVKTNTNQIQKVISEGTRNQTLFAKASSFFNSGISEEFITEELQKINLVSCNPPLAKVEVEQIIRSASRNIADPLQVYKFDSGNTLYCPNGSIEKSQVIANFQAVLAEQIEIDDGAEGPKDMRYRLEILHPKLARSSVVVTPVQLEDGSWVASTDASLIVLGPRTYSQHLRIAIRSLGSLDNRRKAFINLGWNTVDGKSVYLANNGAITADGFSKDYFTSLEFGGPSGYEITEATNGAELSEIFLKVRKLLNVTKKRITTALFAAVFRAPLIKFLPTDFCLGVFGITGSHKSTVTALFTTFFGSEFSYNNLPESFGSTQNAIERKAFLIYAAMLVIDDWVPGEHSKYKADYILRSTGNRQGRGRMNADTTLKKTFFPRSLIILTGEDIQVEQSLRARMVILPMEKNIVDVELLTELQGYGENGDFNKFLGSYIRWIISIEANLKEDIKKRYIELRNDFQKNTKHARTAPNLAHLMLGIELFAKFCLAKNLFTHAEASEFMEDSKLHLLELIETQNSHQETSDPINVFSDILRTILTNGTAHIKHPNPIELGVLYKSVGYSSVHQYGSQTEGECIGEFKNGYMCLIKSATFAKVKQYAIRHGTPFNFSERAIGDRLKDRGLLLCDKGRNTIKIQIGDNRPRCWEFTNWLAILMPELSAPEAPFKNSSPSLSDKLASDSKDANGTASNKNLH